MSNPAIGERVRLEMQSLLEKVYERLERRNEQYYGKLEKAGEVPSLDEIERRADEGLRAEAEDSAGKISKKTQVFSGLALRAGTRAMLFFGKSSGFLRFSDLGAGTRVPLFPEKSMVLSGPAGAAAPGSVCRQDLYGQNGRHRLRAQRGRRHQLYPDPAARLVAAILGRDAM